MARGIVVPFTLDPREFTRQIRRVEYDLADVGDAFESVEGDADEAFRRIERDFDDAVDAMQRDASTGGARVGDNLSDGIRRGRVGEVGDEVAEEFTQNFGEAIRSGNPADAILETFTSLGPALGALGLGSAVVAGIIKGIVDRGAEAQQATLDMANDLFAGFVSAGEEAGVSSWQAYRKGLLDEASLDDRLMQALGTDNAVEAWQQVGQIAGETGLEIETVVAGLTDFTAKGDEARAIVKETADAVNQDLIAAMTGAVEANNDQLNQLRDQSGALDDLVGEQNRVTDAADLTGDALRNNRDYLRQNRDEVKGLEQDLRRLPRETRITIIEERQTRRVGRT